MKRQSGFGIIQVLLVIVVIGLIGGTSWYVFQARKKTNQSLQNTANSQNDPLTAEPKKEASKTDVDPTADWISYTNKVGVFSLKYPKTWATASAPELCTEELVLLGGNSSSVGKCATESFGQMYVVSSIGDNRTDLALDTKHYPDVKTAVANADGVTGTRSEGAYKSSAEDVLTQYADGTKVVRYVFYATNGRTYAATYAQTDGFPDVLADFETMVTKTLKFNL
ncbi:MAG: hypothetical protein V4702_03310 [Patescibacteria group bacterium]